MFKSKIKKHNGFTLPEVIVVAGILSFIVMYMSSAFGNLYNNYKFKDYSSKVQYFVKYARVLAIEKSLPMAICTVTSNNNSYSLRIYPLNGVKPTNLSSLDNNYCKKDTFYENSKALRTLEIDTKEFRNLKVNADNIAFDPRGIAIVKGNFCISTDNKNFTMRVTNINLLLNEGNGACS